MAYARDRNGAFAILDEKRGWLPRGGQRNAMGSWFMLALVIEGLVILGEHLQAGRLYPLIGELGIEFVIWNGQSAWFWFLVNPRSKGGMIGATTNESQAMCEACLSIEKILAVA